MAAATIRGANPLPRHSQRKSGDCEAYLWSRSVAATDPIEGVRTLFGSSLVVPESFVGIFAKNSVGDITRPAASTHMHLVFKDAKTGKQVARHIERLGLSTGAILRLPKTK